MRSYSVLYITMFIKVVMYFVSLLQIFYLHNFCDDHFMPIVCMTMFELSDDLCPLTLFHTYGNLKVGDNQPLKFRCRTLDPLLCKPRA